MWTKKAVSYTHLDVYKRQERVKEGYRASYGIVAGFSAIIAVIVVLLNGPIITSFLGDGMSREAYGAGTGYLSFIAYFFVFIGMKAVSYTHLLQRGRAGVPVPYLPHISQAYRGI